MVQDILPSVLPAVVAELREWTVSLRLNAARCLQSVLLLAQGAASAHLPHLLPPLCSAAGDEDQQVAQYVVQAAQVGSSCMPEYCTSADPIKTQPRQIRHVQ